MWSQILLIILPFISVLFFLLSIYGHKLEIKKLNKKIEFLESQKKYNAYIFTKLNTSDEFKN